jgi:hypothetical protein
MRIVDFSNFNPGDRTLSIIFNSTGSYWTVKEVNINVTDGEYENLFSILQNVTGFAFLINGVTYTTSVVTTTQKINFFNYDVEDFLIPSGSSIVLSQLYDTTLIPGPDVTGFQNSDYDALISNATNSRTSGYIYEVDRSSEYIIPGNYDNIISESAEYANVADSNYTSIGILRSRYDGSETTSADFGVEPLIAGKVFEGAEYLASSSNNFICSQSLSDRSIEEYFFTIPTGSAEDSETPILNSKVFEFDGNRILPIKNKKIWVKENRAVIETNLNGIVAGSITECTI